MTLPRLVRTASFRLATLYVLVFVSSVGALGLVVLWTTRAAIEAQVADRIAAETRYLRNTYDTDGAGQLRALVRQRDRSISALDYALVDVQGHELAGRLPPRLGGPGWNHVRIPDADERGAEPELVLVTALPDGARLSVGDDLGRVAEAGRVIGRVFVLAIVGMLLLGIAGGAWISRTFLRRVDAIAGTAEAIIRGNLQRRVPVRNTLDDLDRLAITLNRMLDRNETLLVSLQQLGSNVAHDLRTPLSQLRQTLEEAQRTATTVDAFRASVDQAITRAQTMQQIFASLLRIAQIEGGSGGAPFEALDLAGVLDTVADAYVPLAEQDGYAVQLDANLGCWVDGDRQLLMQMLANLIENALQHTPPGTRIHAGVVRRSVREVQLLVEDSGPGVAALELPRITERFYRCERSRTTPGHGLGLSLVAAIADLHGAALSIEDASPGLRFRITFPASAQAAIPQAGDAATPARLEIVWPEKLLAKTKV